MGFKICVERLILNIRKKKEDFFYQDGRKVGDGDIVSNRCVDMGVGF